MLITFLRHGQSEHNAELTTSLDSELTLFGHQQAILTAQRFQDEGITEHSCASFVSPLLRTLQTFEPIHNLLLMKPEIIADICEFFSERNDGYKEFLGLSPEIIRQRFPWAVFGTEFETNPCWWPLTQEDDLALYKRSERVRDRLVATYFHSGKDVLIVSHADPIGRMIEAFLRVSPNLEGPPWSGNCGVTRLQLLEPANAANIVFLNDQSHLSSLSTVVSS